MSKKILYLLLIIMIAACKPSLDMYVPSAGTANLNNISVIGGSYMAGLQNGALSANSQQYSIPALMVQQFNKAKKTELKFPWITAGEEVGVSPNGLGFSGVMWLAFDKLSCDTVNGYVPKQTFIGSSFSLTPTGNDFLNPALTTTLFSANVSYPYCTVKSLFTPDQLINPNIHNPFYQRFASTSTTAPFTYFSKLQNPSFSIIYLGMDDIYNVAQQGAAFSSQPSFSIPSADSFSYYLDKVLKMQLRGSKQGVIATIPHLDYFPFYNLISPQLLALDAQKAADLNSLYGNNPFLHFKAGSNGFIAESETGTLTSLYPSKIKLLEANEKILLSIPLDSFKCQGLGVIKPIPGKYILDKAELSQITAAIDAYNLVITQKAAEYNLALVDMNVVMSQVQAGITYNANTSNTEFIKGGFFSLDGFTPTNKGNAIIANAFLEAINAKYHSAFPSLYPDDYTGIIFP